jgi:hypothetical protein
VALQGKEYLAIEVPEDLGMDCQRYKWRQNQSHVEVFIPLPAGVPASKVRRAVPDLPTNSGHLSGDDILFI